MIDGKRAAKGAALRVHNGGEARGRDKGKGTRLRTVGGYKGAGAGVEGRQTRRGENVRRGVVV